MPNATFIANFVMTLDSKVRGHGPDYWPIGSPHDLQTLLALRATTDALIHGRATALGHPHLERLNSPAFQGELTRPYTYIVLCNYPTPALVEQLTYPNNRIRTILVSTAAAPIPTLPAKLELWRSTQTLWGVAEFAHDGRRPGAAP